MLFEKHLYPKPLSMDTLLIKMLPLFLLTHPSFEWHTNGFCQLDRLFRTWHVTRYQRSHPQLLNYIEDALDAVVLLEKLVNLTDDAPFSPENIVFTCNGLRGSACASFINFLIEYYNATAYTASSRPGNPIEFQAFAAGLVIDSDSLYQQAASERLNGPSLLPPIEIAGTLRLALCAAVSPNVDPGEFVQYRTYPAQNQYSLTPEQWASPLANWEYVATQAFNSYGGEEHQKKKNR